MEVYRKRALGGGNAFHLRKERVGNRADPFRDIATGKGDAESRVLEGGDRVDSRCTDDGYKLDRPVLCLSGSYSCIGSSSTHPLS